MTVPSSRPVFRVYTPFRLRLLLLPPPPSPRRRTDPMSDTLTGSVLSNGAGMELDSVTPPVRAARQESPPPHQDALWETSGPFIGISLMRFGLQKNAVQAL